MDIILLRDVRNLGTRGDVVTVKPGYARNFLIPKGYGLTATPANIRYYEEQKKKIDLRHAQARDEAAARAGELAGLRLSIAKRVGESETLYGSVTPAEVEAALADQGVTVDKRRIDLGGGIKTIGDHVVRIDLHPEVVAEVELTVVPEA